MKNISKHIPKGLIKNNRIIAKKGEGCWVWDKNDYKYLDMTSGIGALSTGHSHPRIIDAVQRQLSRIVHAQQNCFFSHIEQEKLIDKMLKILSNGHNNIFFTNSGSEATDNAIKIARMSTKKPNIIAIQGGFHGRTLCAMSLTSSKISYRQGFQPLIPGVFFSKDNIQDIDQILETQTSPDETSAIIMEPILGEGGIKEISPEFIKYVRKICNNNNIKLIFDEVQCGSGRTGYWWASERVGVTPDLMTFAKGIGSGFPIGGISGKSEIFDSMSKNSLGGTYNGNVISTVASKTTIDIINEENLLINAKNMGEKIAEGLAMLPFIEGIRQYGLFIAVDIVPYVDVKEIIEKAIQYQLILISCGNNSLRIIPPLTINSEEVEEFLYRLHLTFSKF
jgi:4-aminobutyrate aminotransferase-like enzyme